MTMHERTRLLVGDEGLVKLAGASVAVMGVGGVGGVAAEQLCRAGVGRIVLCDFAQVTESNLNRQVIALRSTVGRSKVEVAAERLADIDPACRVEAQEMFIDPDSLEKLGLTQFDFVLDCIDSLNPKTQLIHACREAGVPVIISTGAGGRLDPTGVQVSDIFKVTGCPLARHLKKRLRSFGVPGPIPAVHSTVPPQKPKGLTPVVAGVERGRPRVPVGSISFVPPVFGCVMGSYVVRELLGGME